MIADHCIEVWEKASPKKNAVRNRVMKRDLGLCQVPGCGGPGRHRHHVEFLSAGGADDEENQIWVCPAHHLQCIHNRWVHVTGKAPHELRWQLGVRPGYPPLLDVMTTPDGTYLAARRDGDGTWPDSFPPPGAAATGLASEEDSSLS